MKIGLTYDLRSDYLKTGYTEEETAEFDREETIDSIEGSLKELGYEVDRIGNVRNLIRRISKNERWDLVFNIAEGINGFGREAQVPAILDSCNIAYTFSDPLTLAITLHKGITKIIVRSFGIPTPDFKVIAHESEARNVKLPFPLFAKPVAEGTAKGITSMSWIQTREELIAACKNLIRNYEQPVLIERYLPGREFTVGIIGNGKNARGIGTLEIIPINSAEPHAYTYWNKENYETVIKYKIVRNIVSARAQRIALAAWNALGCKDAGRVDLREDEKGDIQFLEVNSLAGLHPKHSDLPILCSKVGISYNELISEIVASAMRRWQHTHPAFNNVPVTKKNRVIINKIAVKC